jgi:glycerol kinase
VVFVPAFSGLFAPYWRDDARGVIVGLTRFANKGHIARAALEATAYQTYDLVEAMLADTGLPELGELRADGGMTKNELLMQFQSDVLGAPVAAAAVAEITATGAAYAAGLATGFWAGLDELRANYAITRRWEPKMLADERARGGRRVASRDRPDLGPGCAGAGRAPRRVTAAALPFRSAPTPGPSRCRR